MWVEDGDVNDPDTLKRILATHGLGSDLLAQTKDPEVKKLLIANTNEAAERGVFGAPTYIVRSGSSEEQLFWGQDRTTLVEKALLGWTPKLP
jgi:2-hydroxychromene-2-carboxylate isomerase